MSGCKAPEDRDYSEILFPGELPHPVPQWEVALKIGTCVLVELVAVFGNLVLIAVVARTPHMRSTTNCYIANMAVADLLIALVPMWIHVSTDVISKDKDAWPLGGFLCKFNSFVQVTAMVASVLTLMAIAGDRFFGIMFPLKARVTKRRVGVGVTIVWLCALGIGLPPLFFYTYRERQWKDYLETFCTDVWPAVSTSSGGCDQGLTSKRAYWTVVTVVLNWLPMTVMTGVYAIIIYRLRFSRVRPEAGRNSLSAIHRRSKRKVVKMLLIVLVTFMACTIPFQVTNLYPIYRHETGDKLPAWHRPVYYAAVFLMYTNSAINPILYGGLNENFRRGARHFLHCLLCREGGRLGQSASTRLSLSRLPRLSLVENEAHKVKAKDTDAKRSLCQLAVSAAYINTALAAKEREPVMEPRTPVVNFDLDTLVIGDRLQCGLTSVAGDGVLSSQSHAVGDGVLSDQNLMTDSGVHSHQNPEVTGNCVLSDQDPKTINNGIPNGLHTSVVIAEGAKFEQSSTMIGDGVLTDQNPAVIRNDGGEVMKWPQGEVGADRREEDGEVGADRREEGEAQGTADSSIWSQ